MSVIRRAVISSIYVVLVLSVISGTGCALKDLSIPGLIKGKVRDANSGQGIEGVKITITPAVNDQTTDANGNYEITNVSAGDYNVTASKAGYGTEIITVTVKTGEEKVVDISIKAKIIIKGKVTNSQGKGMESVTMTTNPTTSTKTTDANGNYEITDVPAGDYTVTANKSGYNTGTKQVSAVKTGEIVNCDMTLTFASATIWTVAGTGAGGYGGDGGQAISAQINYPHSIAIDGSGNIYFTDQDNHRVRKIDSLGIISTIAGTGVQGYGGDGGQAVSAQLNYPTGIAMDGSGSIYIADRGNHRIRKINNSGIISTVTGTGIAGYSGDGGQAISAQINDPYGISADGSGNVYIADYENHRVRKIDNSGIISTIAGTGTAGYSGDEGQATSAKLYAPYDVAIDGSGNIYIADSGNDRVRKVNTSGIISSIAGTGATGYNGDERQATSAQLSSPRGIATDASGNIYIADFGNYRVRKINNSGIINTIAGTGTNGYDGDEKSATYAKLAGICGIVVDSPGNVYLADWNNHRIRKILK